ncbi:MAG: aspartate ammonia-lyase, partial [Bacteroidales bacterium]|nr:aspartate ammonia-lyase [Bacteroidales bacterium]
MANYRIESDLLGPREVPAEALYGVQTLRGMENFHISGAKLSDYPSFIKGLAITKKAAAIANEKVGMVTKEQCDAIVKACDELLEGKHHEHFP